MLTSTVRGQRCAPIFLPSTCPRACSRCGPVELDGAVCWQDGGELLPERHVLGGQISLARQRAPRPLRHAVDNTLLHARRCPGCSGPTDCIADLLGV